jgi:hypothetical protein
MNAQQCGFEAPQNYDTYENKNGISSSSDTNYCINVAFRIVRNNDGGNTAFNPADLPQALAVLNQSFNPHGITIVQV